MPDIFEEDELAADAVTEAGAEQGDEQQEQQSAEGPARDEHGRFAPKAGDDGADGQEGDPDADESQQQSEQQQRQVPQGALHAEREKHKATKAQLEQAQAQLNALAQMRAQIAARKPEAVAAPEGEDPASETAYLRQRQQELEGTLHGMQQREQLSQVEMAEHRQLGSVLTQSEAEYRAVKPDYDAAINHVVTARAQELALYGFQPHQIQQALQEEVLDITRAAIQQGRSPAEVGYELARLRGYRPEAAQQAQGQQQQGNGQRIVDAVGAAKAASRSLGQASGTGVTKDLNAQAIAAMSPDEFEALYSTPAGKAMIDAL